MSKGAHAKLTKLTKKEIKASKEIGKLLVKNNIYFAGIDFVQEKLIGDINVTKLPAWRLIKTYPELTLQNPSGIIFNYLLTER